MLNCSQIFTCVIAIFTKNLRGSLSTPPVPAMVKRHGYVFMALEMFNLCACLIYILFKLCYGHFWISLLHPVSLTIASYV